MSDIPYHYPPEHIREWWKKDFPTVKDAVECEPGTGTAARNAVIYQKRHFAGLTLAEIGAEFGLSSERVRQIVYHAERHQNRWLRSRESRPLDMGGPRDQWLTFFPDN